MPYASNTSVSVESTQSEIQRLLTKFGADDIGIRQNMTELFGQIAFRCRDRLIRFTLPLPDPKSPQFSRDGRGNIRSASSGLKAWEQACRSRWRALLLCIKAKLEAVESKIEHFEEAFLAQTVDPASGRTVAETVRPMLTANYQANGGQPIALLTHSTG